MNIYLQIVNSLDPDQARHFVGPDQGPNCLQRLSVDHISGERVTVKLGIPLRKIVPYNPK